MSDNIIYTVQTKFYSSLLGFSYLNRFFIGVLQN